MSMNLGYLVGTGIFAAIFAVAVAVAVVGDLLDKPLDSGGFQLSRYWASATLLALIAILIFVFPQKPARQGH